MIATISKTGVLIAQAENSLEEFALSTWRDRADIRVKDLERMECRYYRGSSLKVIAEMPADALQGAERAQ